MQASKINPATVGYYIAASCFPEKLKGDTELLRSVENAVREFLFTPAAIAEKEGGIIGKYRINSNKYPIISIYERATEKYIGEIDGNGELLSIYLPTFKEQIGRTFLFFKEGGNYKYSEEKALLIELAFPFAGD